MTDSLHLKYKHEAVRLPENFTEGMIRWTSPSNIALVKYWGKKEGQIPANPSLSMTLKHAVSDFTVRYRHKNSKDRKGLDYYFHNQAKPEFTVRIERFLRSLHPYFPFLEKLHLIIHSDNTFPHSSGIASSAASMSSLALCSCSIEEQIRKESAKKKDFLRKASYMSRLGSGSACRSVYPGYTVWGKHDRVPGSADEYAIPVNTGIHEEMLEMRDAILIISSGKKAVSSSAGHELMKRHPMATTRFNVARNHIPPLLESLRSGDFERYSRIVETEALMLHGLMMSSSPWFILMKPNTLKAIEKIRQFRQHSKLPLCFTLDAGPNIHLLYPQHNAEEVEHFIEDELQYLCENRQWIADEMGRGPVKLS